MVFGAVPSTNPTSYWQPTRTCRGEYALLGHHQSTSGAAASILWAAIAYAVWAGLREA